MRCWRFWVWVAVEGAAERWVTPFGHAMIAGLGLRLIWRGLRGLGVGRTDAAGGHQHDHDDHAHDQGGPDHARGPQCGHAHGPSPEEVAQVKGCRDGLALVAGIALRPCSGALFVLILTWQLGVALAGVAGAFVMGLGTALMTCGTAVLSVWLREGAVYELGGGRIAQVFPVVELAVGLVLAGAALGLLIGGF